MSTAAAALRAAIHDALVADARARQRCSAARKSTTSRRARAAFPYVTLGEARIADFSAGSEPGEEHQLTLHAWSRQGGHKEAHLIAGALLQALDDAPLDARRPSPGQSALRASPTCGARPTGAPITRWCASAR